MATEIEQLFIRIGAITRGFDDAMNRVEKKAKDADTKLAINPKVNPQSLKSLNAEMDRLKGRAAELRGNLLTIKPTVDNPNAVKDLEHELAKVESRMQLVGKAADDLKDRIGRIKDSGDKIAGIGRSLSIGITLPIIAAGTAVAVLAGKTGEYAEEIANLSQSTGISARNLQVLKFIADNAGLSFENVTTAAGMVQQKLMGVEDDSGNAAKAFERLGIGIYDAQGNLKSMDTLFPELIKKLQGMSNQTERNMLAAQVFGRGWRELAPILGMTAAEMDAAAKRAEELGIVMSDEALESAQEFDDAIDDLKQQATGLARGLVSDLIPTLKNELIPALVDILKWGGSVLKWFMSLPDPVKKLGLGVILLTAAFGPLLSMFGNGISLLAQLKLATMAAGLATGATTTSFSLLMGGLASAVPIIITVTGAVVALAAAWNTAREAVDAYNAIQDARKAAEQDRRGTKIMDDYIKKGDHSERKKIESQMAQQRADAERARQQQDSYASQMSNMKDMQAAEQTLYDMRKRNASELGKLHMDRDQALQQAEGPRHAETIKIDYKDRERILLAKQAKEAAEIKKRQAEELKRAREKDIALAKAAADKLSAIQEAELQGYETTRVNQLSMAGKSYEADMQTAVNTYRRGWRELDRIAKENGPGAIYGRWLSLLTDYYKNVGEISARFNAEEEAKQKDALVKTLEADRKKETANLSMWERITEVLNNYSDRLTGALYGESAVRIQQLERSRAAEVKYLEENIKDEETKASTIAALNADYDMQKNDIHAEDERRYQEQMSWWQNLKQSVDFSSAEGLWKRMTTTPSLAFAGPSVNQSFAGPSVNMSAGMGLSQVATLQQQALSEQQEGNRRLRNIEERLTPR
jgi:hypothetical protein